MTIDAGIPLEALTEDLIITTSVAGAVIVALLAADQLRWAQASWIDWILWCINKSLLAAARVGAAQIEAYRIFRTIVELGVVTFVKVAGVQMLHKMLGGQQIGAAQAVVIVSQVLFEHIHNTGLVTFFW